MKTSLVTGGAGFIGSHLVKKLLSLKHKVVVIDDLSTGFRENLPPRSNLFQFYAQSITANLTPIFKKYSFDYIFHLAAQIDVRKSVLKPQHDAQTNILGTINLLEQARRTKIKKFIYSSTGGALYGEPQKIPVTESHPINPLSFYGASKFAAEKYIETYYNLFRIPYIILRYANVYGPHQNPLGEAGVVAIFIHQLIREKTPALFGYGHNQRDYVYVDDIVQANLWALESKKNKAYNIGTGRATPTTEIFQLIQKGVGSQIKPKLCPARPGEVQAISLDAKQAKQELQWEPQIPLEEGIQRTIAWFLKNKRLKTAS